MMYTLVQELCPLDLVCWILNLKVMVLDEE